MLTKFKKEYFIDEENKYFQDEKKRIAEITQKMERRNIKLKSPEWNKLHDELTLLQDSILKEKMNHLEI